MTLTTTSSWPAEAETLAMIEEALTGLPLEYREEPSARGFSLLRGAANVRIVPLHGDRDALVLVENTGLDISSETTCAVSACKHDRHVAMLDLARRQFGGQ